MNQNGQTSSQSMLLLSSPVGNDSPERGDPDAPGSFGFTAPVDGATGVSRTPLLQFSAPSGADIIYIYLSASVGGGYLIYSIDGAETSLQLPAAGSLVWDSTGLNGTLTADAEWNLTATAYNAFGATDNTPQGGSGIDTFTTESEAVAGGGRSRSRSRQR